MGKTERRQRRSRAFELGSREGRAAVFDAVGMRTVRIIIAGRCRVVWQRRRRGTGSRLAFWRGCDRGGCDGGEWYVGRRWEGGGGGGGSQEGGVGPRGMTGTVKEGDEAVSEAE